MKIQPIIHNWKIGKFNAEMDVKQLVLTKMTHIIKERQSLYFHPGHEDSS